MERSELVERALEIARSAGTPKATSDDRWLALWREVAQVTDGLVSDDPRVGPVLNALAECEVRYKAQDLEGFQQAAARVKRLMAFVPGARIWWEAVVGQRLVVLGPAIVEHVHQDDGRLFVFVVWKDTQRWIAEAIITKTEEGRP